jgi:hypothetical protein
MKNPRFTFQLAAFAYAKALKETPYKSIPCISVTRKFTAILRYTVQS